MSQIIEKKKINRGSLVYIMSISVLLMLIGIALSIVSSFLLNSTRNEILRQQARLSAKSVVAQAFFRMELAYGRSIVLIKKNKGDFSSASFKKLKNIENIKKSSPFDIDWIKVITLNSPERMIFPSSPAEKGFPLQNCSIGGYEVDVHFTGGDKGKSVDNFNGSSMAFSPVTGKNTVNPFTLDLVINLKRMNGCRRFIVEIGKQWNYAVCSFESLLNIGLNSKITGDSCSLFKGSSRGHYNKGFPLPSINISLPDKTPAPPPSVYPVILGNLCSIAKKPITEKPWEMASALYDPITITPKLMEYWRFGEKVYNVPYIDPDTLLALNYLSFPSEGSDSLFLDDKLADLGFCIEEKDAHSLIISNKGVWGLSFLGRIFQNLYSNEPPENNSGGNGNDINNNTSGCESSIREEEKSVRFLELTKPLKLSGNKNAPPDYIFGYSNYFIDACVISQGKFRAGEDSGVLEPLPGIELDNCTLTVNGDLFLSTVILFPKDKNDFSGIPYKDKLHLSEEQKKSAPAIIGKNSALIVNGNIFIMDAKMESLGHNFVIYANKNILMRPIRNRSGNTISFNGAVVARGNIYSVPFSEDSFSSDSDSIICIKGAVACGGIPVFSRACEREAYEYELKRYMNSISKNGLFGDKYFINKADVFSINNMIVEYDPTSTGFLNQISGWIRIKSWRESR